MTTQAWPRQEPIHLRLVLPPETPVRRQPRRSVAALRPASLAWGLFFFLSTQMLLSLALYSLKPEWRDPEFGRKLVALQRHRAAQPERPLVLALGSSRIALGLRPDVIETAPHTTRAPLLFNFGILGAGPVIELLCLERLLAAGIKPDLILVECWAPFWHQVGVYAEAQRFEPTRYAWGDLALLQKYQMGRLVTVDGDGKAHTEERNLTAELLRGFLVPWHQHRFTFMNMLAPRWLPWGNRKDTGWKALDDYGWLARDRAARQEPELSRKSVDGYREYFTPILHNYELSEVSDRAMRALLDRCRQEGIKVALLHMPEGEEFQTWYPSQVVTQVESYLAALSTTYTVPVVNARTWMKEADFLDTSHLGAESAAVFTRRLYEEELPRLLKKPE